jgi:Flp pilus assembly protein TadD
LSLQTNDKALGRKAAFVAEKFAQNSADAELLYSLAKFRYRSGALRASERLFARVQKGATTYMKAQYFRGVVLIRLKKLEPANQAFREAYETSVDAVDGSDEKRIQNQALFAMARIAYE